MLRLCTFASDLGRPISVLDSEEGVTAVTGARRLNSPRRFRLTRLW